MVKLTVDHLDRMMIPDDYRNCVLSKIPNSCTYKSVVLQYIENIGRNISLGRGFLFFGEYSRGKSGLGSILLKAAAAHNHIGLWISVKNIPDYVIERTKFDSEKTMMMRALAVPLLVLDEFVLFGDKRDWYTESVIRDRISDKKATIITTNLGPSKIKEKYPALSAVMMEAIIPLEIKGHDFRAPIAEELEREFKRV